jgi:hypothetical protein
METPIRMVQENPKKEEVDSIQFQKMLLLYNALNDGWTIKKRKDSYIFVKSHEGKKEVLLDSYLTKFMKTNLDLSKLLK